MLEAVWENSNNKLFGKKIPQEKSVPDLFLKTLNEYSEKSYQNKFDNPPSTAFGNQYSNLLMGDEGISRLLSQLKPGHSNKALFLSQNNITDKGLTLLAQQLKKDQMVQHLILSKNKITISEFAKAAVMDMLKVNHTIGWLVFGKNLIHDPGLKHLAMALKKNKGVKHLVLSENEFSDEGLSFLLSCIVQHPKLESLFLAGNNLSDKSLIFLEKFILNSKTIKRIDIRGTNLSISNYFNCQNLSKKKGIKFLIS